MKRWLILIAILMAVTLGNVACAGRGGAYPRTRVPEQRVVVDVSVFYDELAPYGRWFSLDDYGWVWTPSGVPVGWRPYTDGYWVYTDYGWTWVSRHSWGWAPFHYGRWFFHPRHGWVWQPGTVWGPAWVVWRHHRGLGGAGWIGWAPMPPQIGWRAVVGLSVEWGEIDRIVEPHWYSFVEERHFTARDLDGRLELPARSVTLLQGTENVTSYTWAENRVINRSVSAELIEQVAGRPVERRRVADAGSAGRGSEVRGDEVLIYRPRIERETTSRAPHQTDLPMRKPDSTLEQMRRREETQQRQLEIQHAREREALEKRQQVERKLPPRQVKPEDISRQHEIERRALEAQRQREQQILKNRQEEQRKVQPVPTAPARREKAPKPTPERKPPVRRPDQ